jgi:hypothetical protein
MRNRKVTGGILGNRLPRRRPKSKSSPVPAIQWLPFPASPPPPAAAPLELVGPPHLTEAQRQQWIDDLKEWARALGLPPGLSLRELEERRRDQLNELSARALGFPPGLSTREVEALLERDTRTGIKVRMSGKKGGRPKGSETGARVLAEFKKRRPTTPSKISDSALAERIGKEFGLKKRASIEAIKPAKKPRSKPA